MFNKSSFHETALKQWAYEYLKDNTHLPHLAILNIVSDEINKIIPSLKNNKTFKNRIIKISKENAL